jgi:hypothetical protein
MKISRFSWPRGGAVALGLFGALLLTDAVMVLVDVLPQRPVSGSSDIAHWRSELMVTFGIVFVPGVSALVGALLLWLRSRNAHKEERANAA